MAARAGSGRPGPRRSRRRRPHAAIGMSRVSAASAAGDAGFSIARDAQDREQVTIWRRDASGTWVAVFDLRLNG